MEQLPNFSIGSSMLPNSLPVANCSLSFLLLVVNPAFAIKLLSHSQPLLSSDPLFMNHYSHGSFHPAYFFAHRVGCSAFLLLS